MEKQQVAKMIDHTLLKADATHEQLRALCDEAKNTKLPPYALTP